MPTSFHGQISTILNLIFEINPASILDIGVGFGKYGVLLRDLLDVPYERYGKETWKIRIDGIEGYPGYENPIHTYAYDHVYYDKAEVALDQIGTVYDLALMIDVLEHFEKEAGRQILNRILEKCKLLIIAVPVVPCPQTYLDNALEAHKSRWDANDFAYYPVISSGIIPMFQNNGSIVVLIKGKANS